MKNLNLKLNFIFIKNIAFNNMLIKEIINNYIKNKENISLPNLIVLQKNKILFFYDNKKEANYKYHTEIFK